ncbi:hypothetical protein NEUTE2DRAFT_134143 [Neurospora tetrasperma FGSC 2509]|nr:hypothetical protein NEUTE2DRAFT_134143 [Neurospora tetrasperma FGSC 2509]
MSKSIILTNLDEPGLRESLDTPCYFGVGGGPIDSVALGKLKAVLHPEATASQIRGMTEFGVSALFRWGEQDETGSVDRLLEGYRIRLVEHNGHDTTTEGRPGELFVRLPSLMSGYISMSPYVGVDHEDWSRTGTGTIVSVKSDKLYVYAVRKAMESSKTPRSTHSGHLSPGLSSEEILRGRWYRNEIGTQVASPNIHRQLPWRLHTSTKDIQLCLPAAYHSPHTPPD